MNVISLMDFSSYRPGVPNLWSGDQWWYQMTYWAAVGHRKKKKYFTSTYLLHSKIIQWYPFTAAIDQIYMDCLQHCQTIQWDCPTSNTKCAKMLESQACSIAVHTQQQSRCIFTLTCFSGEFLSCPEASLDVTAKVPYQPYWQGGHVTHCPTSSSVVQ